MSVSTGQRKRQGDRAAGRRPGGATSFPPVRRRDARVLVLGSMPGTASLRARQYYAHPRNGFWAILGACLGFAPDLPYARRLAALRNRRVALWDVVHRCRRRGSLDAAIESGSVVANDIARLLRRCPRVRTVLFNGHAAEALFERHILPLLPPDRAERLRRVRMPSTSPAYAALDGADKRRAWRAALGMAGVPLAYGHSRSRR